MSTEFPRKRGAITTSSRHEIDVHREYDLPRDEMILTVSCRLPQRTHIRRVTFFHDDFTDSEQLRLVDAMVDMLTDEVRGDG